MHQRCACVNVCRTCGLHRIESGRLSFGCRFQWTVQAVLAERSCLPLRAGCHFHLPAAAAAPNAWAMIQQQSCTVRTQGDGLMPQVWQSDGSWRLPGRQGVRTGDYLAVLRIRPASWLLYSIQGRAAAAAAAENAGCAASPCNNKRGCHDVSLTLVHNRGASSTAGYECTTVSHIWTRF
jgi:hypothetical protein